MALLGRDTLDEAAERKVPSTLFFMLLSGMMGSKGLTIPDQALPYLRSRRKNYVIIAEGLLNYAKALKVPLGSLQREFVNPEVKFMQDPNNFLQSLWALYEKIKRRGPQKVKADLHKALLSDTNVTTTMLTQLAGDTDKLVDPQTKKPTAALNTMLPKLDSRQRRILKGMTGEPVGDLEQEEDAVAKRQATARNNADIKTAMEKSPDSFDLDGERFVWRKWDKGWFNPDKTRAVVLLTEKGDEVVPSSPEEWGKSDVNLLGWGGKDGQSTANTTAVQATAWELYTTVPYFAAHMKYYVPNAGDTVYRIDRVSDKAKALVAGDNAEAKASAPTPEPRDQPKAEPAPEPKPSINVQLPNAAPKTPGPSVVIPPKPTVPFPDSFKAGGLTWTYDNAARRWREPGGRFLLPSSENGKVSMVPKEKGGLWTPDGTALLALYPDEMDGSKGIENLAAYAADIEKVPYFASTNFVPAKYILPSDSLPKQPAPAEPPKTEPKEEPKAPATAGFPDPLPRPNGTPSEWAWVDGAWRKGGAGGPGIYPSNATGAKQTPAAFGGAYSPESSPYVAIDFDADPSALTGLSSWLRKVPYFSKASKPLRIVSYDGEKAKGVSTPTPTPSDSPKEPQTAPATPSDDDPAPEGFRAFGAEWKYDPESRKWTGPDGQYLAYMGVNPDGQREFDVYLRPVADKNRDRAMEFANEIGGDPYFGDNAVINDIYLDPLESEPEERPAEPKAEPIFPGVTLDPFTYGGNSPVIQAGAEAAARAWQANPDKALVESTLASGSIPCDDSQKNAIANKSQRAVIIAAAGSGKTRTIAARVLNLIRGSDPSRPNTGVPPDKILVTTFGRLAAKELKGRIVKTVGEDMGSRVDAVTTHSLAFSILREGRIFFDLDWGMKGDKYYRETAAQIMARLASAKKSGTLRNELPERFAKDYFNFRILKGFIGQHRSKSMTPLHAITEYENYHKGDIGFLSLVAGYIIFEQAIGTKFNPEEEAALRQFFEDHPEFREGLEQVHFVKRKNSAGKWETKKVDWEEYVRDGIRMKGGLTPKPKTLPLKGYDDALRMAAEVLETRPDVRAKMRDKYRHMIVDEAQDLNDLQRRMFDGMTSPELDPNNPATGWLVGDPAQAVFGFRGSSFYGIVDAAKAQSKFDVLFIDENYRSPQEIVEAGDRIKLSGTLGREMPIASRAHKGPRGDEVIGTWTFPSEAGASDTIAQDIQDRADGDYRKKFAVIARTNRELESYEDGMINRRIPYFIKSRPFWRKEPTLLFLSWIAAAMKQQNVGHVPDTLWTLAQTILPKGANQSNPLWKQYLAASDRIDLSSPEKAVEGVLGIRNTAGTDVVAGKAREYGELEAALGDDEDVPEDGNVLSEREDERTKRRLKEYAAFNGIGDVSELLRQAWEQYEKFEPFDPEYVETDRGERKPKRKADNDTVNLETANCVTLITAHSSKGLEFANTYVPMIEGVFPSRTRVSDYYGGAGLARDAAKAFVDEVERNVAYVAITRATERCRVIVTESGPRGDAGGPSEYVQIMGLSEQADKPVIRNEPEGIEESAGVIDFGDHRAYYDGEDFYCYGDE